MRLKYVFISEYKNLKNFELSFDEDNFIDILVGKNGSGKSNLLEAIIEVFHHAISLGEPDQPDLFFDYKITYQIDGKDVTLDWKGQKFFINGSSKQRKSIGKTPTPKNLLVYYSGQNDTVNSIVEKYNSRFSKKIKGSDVSNVRWLIGIGGEYKTLLLSVLLLQEDSCKAKTFLKNALSISQIGLQKSMLSGNGDEDNYTKPILKITLKRPAYAVGRTEFDINNQDDEDRFWKASGKSRNFLDHLYACVFDPKDMTIANGYQPNDSYIFHISIDELRARLPNYTPLDFFNAFDMLVALDMLEDITVPIALSDNRVASVSDFSDGQFQSVYIYAVTELFRTVECLTLLDEPDAFLHPEWQFNFLSQVADISKDAVSSNHILLTTHSASTISKIDSSIFYLSSDTGRTEAKTVKKNNIIKSLSSGLITFTEGEAQLNINQVIQSTDGPILWLEGISDELILKTAWEKLYPESQSPFIIQNAFCKSVLYTLFSRGELSNNYPDRVMFALFDFDEAYNDWNGLQPGGSNNNYVEEDPLKGLTKQLQHDQHYALLLPVPDNDAIKPQVLDPNGKPWTNGSTPHLPIEMVFCTEERIAAHYEKTSTPGGGTLIKFKGNKTKFAKEVVPTFDVESFELFRPMFELMRLKCST